VSSNFVAVRKADEWPERRSSDRESPERRSETEELEERMLSDMERGTSNPRTRRKQRSMGEGPVSERTTHKLPGLHRRPMWERKQAERKWEAGRERRHREDVEDAIEGRDQPVHHGFHASDWEREIHPGDTGSKEPGKYHFSGEGRIDRPIELTRENVYETLFPESIESENLRHFGTTLIDGTETGEPEWQPKPWKTSGPINYIPQTENR